MNSEDRAADELYFDVNPTPALPNREGDHMLRAGETFTVALRAAEKVAAYQFTLLFPNLEVLDIDPGAEMTQGNFGIFNEQHSLTTSFDNEQVQGEFSVTFRATKPGRLSEMLKVSSQITKAEAYKGNETMTIALRFNGQDGAVIAGQGFELYQNSPNPWTHRTQLGFYLPEATAAMLTVYDETGRVLFSQSGDYGKGFNAITLDRALVNSSSVLYYKVETSTDSAVRKMIQMK
jgi:hypothetical protein